MRGARGVLINITGGTDMTLIEVDSAANRIREEVDCDSDANIIFGSTFNPELNGVIRVPVSVVATGIDADHSISSKSQPIELIASTTMSSEQMDSQSNSIETTILEEIPDFAQYTGEKPSLVDSETQHLNLSVQATSIDMLNQQTIISSIYTNTWTNPQPVLNSTIY